MLPSMPRMMYPGRRFSSAGTDIPSRIIRSLECARRINSFSTERYRRMWQCSASNARAVSASVAVKYVWRSVSDMASRVMRSRASGCLNLWLDWVCSLFFSLMLSSIIKILNSNVNSNEIYLYHKLTDSWFD